MEFQNDLTDVVIAEAGPVGLATAIELELKSLFQE